MAENKKLTVIDTGQSATQDGHIRASDMTQNYNTLNTIRTKFGLSTIPVPTFTADTAATSVQANAWQTALEDLANAKPTKFQIDHVEFDNDDDLMTLDFKNWSAVCVCDGYCSTCCVGDNQTCCVGDNGTHGNYSVKADNAQNSDNITNSNYPNNPNYGDNTVWSDYGGENN